MGSPLRVGRRELELELRGNVVVFVNGRLALREEVHTAEVRINAPVRRVESHGCCSVFHDAKSALVVMEHGKESGGYEVKAWLQPVEIGGMGRNTVAVMMSTEGVEWLNDHEKGKCSRCSQAVEFAVGNGNTVDVYLFASGAFVAIESPRERWERDIYAFKIDLPKPYGVLLVSEDLMRRVQQVLRVPRGFMDPQLLRQVSPQS
jgi:hypothetical protein